ncbi:hypothetical protein [Miltoncostaea oceani]|uniref:hypothetical protein n=1 Tax=Miltoncostaea oceani TaxID=2843216 RepID=UPI001C3D74F2|nr:hypothetical protein [Miltoncostaea oceani]
MSAPWMVAKVCQAEELLHQATELLRRAGHEVASAPGAPEDTPARTAVCRDLNALTAHIEESRRMIGPVVRDIAALIPDPA